MVTQRLGESLLFLEANCHTDGDQEYLEAVKKIIDEHAQMRETLERISRTATSEKISFMATASLRKTGNGDSVNYVLDLRQALTKISSLLLDGQQTQKVRGSKTLLGTLLGH